MPRDEVKVDQGDGESFDGGLLIGEHFLHDGLDVGSLVHFGRFVSQHVDVQQFLIVVFEGVDLMRDEDVVLDAHSEGVDKDAVGFAHDVES